MSEDNTVLELNPPEESTAEMPEMVSDDNLFSDLDSPEESLEETPEASIADLEEFTFSNQEAEDSEDLMEDSDDDFNALFDIVDESPVNNIEELEFIDQKLDTLDKISEQSLEQLDNLMEIVNEQDQDSKLEEKPVD